MSGVDVDAVTLARIRENPGETLFIEAGAGTGKTRALVDRVVSLVLAGEPIERVVAITFTEKAAAELKDRVRAGLEGAAHGEGLPRATEALASLDRAQISTIHAFSQTLLRSFAAEAGIDPSFRVLDEVMADRRLQERWRSYLESLAADEDAKSRVQRALALGLASQDMERLAAELSAQASLAARLAESPLQAPVPTWPDLGGMDDELSELPLGAAPREDPLRQRVEGLLSLLRDLRQADAEEREAVLAAGVKHLTERYGVSSIPVWGRDTIGSVRSTAEKIRDRLAGHLQNVRAEALAGLLPLVVRFVLEDVERRGREGALTFDDLILRVSGLLRDNPDAVRQLRERYDVLLVDEFQDTDPHQAEIAVRFAEVADGAGLEAGRLFLVGDPKQSIYRFRRADMAIYSNLRQRVLKDNGAVLPLAANRRSRRTILAWVNTVMAKLIGEGGDPGVQPPYQEIHWTRAEDLAGPGVAFTGGESEGLSAQDVRWLEADAIASLCRRVVVERWEVKEAEGSVYARFRHIAILIPTRVILPALERALADAGVPFRVESGSLVYRTQEVRDLINCLGAIDDPSDEVAVVAALRSPAFACSDVDLARHRAGGGRFDYSSRDLESRQGPVAAGLRTLAKYHGQRRDWSLAALVERFAGECGLAETGVLDQGDRNGYRRVRFIVEQARTFEASGPESLRAFVSWMERRSGDQILDNEGSALDEDEDAVRVLTVHSAKGLEFPIVFVAGLGSAPLNRPGCFLLDRTGDEVAVAVGSSSRSQRFELGRAEELRALEQQHTDAEYARLLYVAATRAKDHLVLSLYHASRAKGCGARRLIEAGAREHASELAAVEGEPTKAQPFAGLVVDDGGAMTQAEFTAAREALAAAAKQRHYTSATAITRAQTQREDDEKPEREDESEPWSRGRAATNLGRAVHAAIQSLPLDAREEQIAAFSRAQAVAEAIPDRAAEVSHLVRRALASRAAGRARQAARALREVPFALRLDGTVLEGFIDLLIDAVDGLEIVDWKTDQVSEAQAQERLRRYELQAGLYVLGIESATGRKVDRVTYVFAGPGLEVSPGEPNELAAAARAWLEPAAAEREAG